MSALFYANAGVAIAATLMAVVVKHPIHALLYFIGSLLSIAMAMAMMGLPFAAALEVIVYAGAIMVLFVFVIMLLGIGPHIKAETKAGGFIRVYLGPVVLGLLLVANFGALLFSSATVSPIATKDISTSLFTTYALGVELASFILLAGLVGAYHLGRKDS